MYVFAKFVKITKKRGILLRRGGGGIKALFTDFLKFILNAQGFFSMSYQIFRSWCGLEITCLSVFFFSVQLQDYTYIYTISLLEYVSEIFPSYCLQNPFIAKDPIFVQNVDFVDISKFRSNIHEDNSEGMGSCAKHFEKVSNFWKRNVRQSLNQ